MHLCNLKPPYQNRQVLKPILNKNVSLRGVRRGGRRSNLIYEIASPANTAGQARNDIKWHVQVDGPMPGPTNMAIDKIALEKMNEGLLFEPRLRLFQWQNTLVSHGYLMDEDKVRDWAKNQGIPNIVKRPTGGGVVVHTPLDLSLSLLWPRHQNILPEKPSESYKVIHEMLLGILKHSSSCGRVKTDRGDLINEIASAATGDLAMTSSKKGAGLNFQFFTPRLESCKLRPAPFLASGNNVNLCFNKPVCHDVMLNGKKVVGGALRVMKNAILYQGTIQIDRVNLDRVSDLRSNLGYFLSSL